MRKFFISFIFSFFLIGAVKVHAATYESIVSGFPSDYVKCMTYNHGSIVHDIYVKSGSEVLFYNGKNAYGYSSFSFCALNSSGLYHVFDIHPANGSYSFDTYTSGFTTSFNPSNFSFFYYPIYEFESQASFDTYVQTHVGSPEQVGPLPVPDPVPDTTMGYIKNVNVSYGPVIPVSDPVNNSYFVNLPDADSSQAYEIIGTFRFPTTQYVLDTGNPLTANFPTRLLGLRFGSMQNNWYEVTKSAQFTGGSFGFDVMSIGLSEFSSNENLSQSEIKVGSMLGYLKSFIIRKVTLDSSGNVLTYSGWSTVNVPKWDIDGSLTSGVPYPIVVDYEAYPDADQKPSNTDVLEDWLNGTQDYYDKVLPEENRDAWNDISGDTYNSYLDNAMNNEDLGSGISRLTSFARSLSAVPDLIATFFSMFPPEITYLMLLSLTLVPIVLIVKIL